MAFTITKWTRHITDDGKDKVVRPKPEHMDHKFRLLDDDKVIYAYGYTTNPDSFAPLDRYQDAYGCVEIQYYNPVKKEWETL